ncbi:delta(1)-pyrroline-2-carboxylate reductase family protein [Oceanithermus sp.]
MKFWNAEETARRLPYGPLAEELAKTLRDAAAGRAQAPQRHVHRLPQEGSLLLMPAWDDTLGVLKRVSVHPANAARGLPLVRAEVVAFDAASGEPLAFLDGEAVTARRTAALSRLAVERLMQAPPRRMLLVGAGRQARAHLEALLELGLEQVFLYNRTLSRAAELAGYARTLGLSAQTVPAPEAAGEVDLVVTATASPTPVVPADLGDAFVVAVGAFTPEMAEVPPERVRASTVVVDTLEGAQAEAGDLIQADVDWSRVHALANVLERGPELAPPLLFKSVGSALFDLAAARLALAQGT